MIVTYRPWSEVEALVEDTAGYFTAHLVAPADGSAVDVYVRPEAKHDDLTLRGIEARLDAMRAGGRDGWHQRRDGSGWQVWLRLPSTGEPEGQSVVIPDTIEGLD